VIVWLNGAFGVGKTTTAAAVQAQIPGSRIFDPETVGVMLAANLADRPVSDFQHWPPWRPLVVATLVHLAQFTRQHLIAPQTVLDHGYQEEILSGLKAAGLDVLLVLLDAEERALVDRIGGSDIAQQWRLDHLSAYRRSRRWMKA
jgi:hypothetical protein